MRQINVNDVDLDSPIRKSKTNRDEQFDIYLGIENSPKSQKIDAPRTTRGRAKQESNFGFASPSSGNEDSIYDNGISSGMKGILSKAKIVSKLGKSSEEKQSKKQKAFNSQKGSLLGKYDEKKQAEEEQERLKKLIKIPGLLGEENLNRLKKQKQQLDEYRKELEE